MHLELLLIGRAAIGSGSCDAFILFMEYVITVKASADVCIYHRIWPLKELPNFIVPLPLRVLIENTFYGCDLII